MADFETEAKFPPNSAVTTIELTMEVAEAEQELLIAELDELGFEAFMNEGSTFRAYLPAPAWDERKKARLTRWLNRHRLPISWKEVAIEAQDWNECWEQSIQPIVVAPFLIRPSWAPVKEDQADLIDIVVDPRMSFGTGHHESTRLVLRSLPSIIEAGCTVLDAGTGTAILAIAAAKLGASRIVAFDIDPWTTENAEENIRQNGVTAQVSFYEGSIDVVTESGFDVVLANINRRVLLEYLPAFAGKIRPNGVLVLAGLLIEDKQAITQAAENAGFECTDEREEGAWWSGIFKRAAV